LTPPLRGDALARVPVFALIAIALHRRAHARIGASSVALVRERADQYRRPSHKASPETVEAFFSSLRASGNKGPKALAY